MIHPLFTTLATHPQLLVEHLGAYAELAALEAGETVIQLRRRAVLGVLTLLLSLVGLGLAGTALLLWAALPLAQMPQPWLLLVVPAVPLFSALLCVWQMRRGSLALSFELLRQQLSQDAALLREAGERH